MFVMKYNTINHKSGKIKLNAKTLPEANRKAMRLADNIADIDGFSVVKCNNTESSMKKNNKKTNDISLTKEEIQTLKSARKIFKKLQKKALTWQKKIDSLEFASDERVKSNISFVYWLHHLYKKTTIDFNSDYSEIFFDLNNVK